MRAHKRLICVVFGAFMSAGALANAMSQENPCPLTNESREWSATCFENSNTGRAIKKQFRKNVVFGRARFAPIVIASPPELVSVNRRGVVVELNEAHLPGFNFEPVDDDAVIARFGYLVADAKRTGKFKCGFYRERKFRVLVPPVYDNCDSFKDSTALVCIGCTNHCESGDCHETDFIGGEGLVINDKNEVLKRFALPTLPRCGDGSPKDSGDAQCRPRPADPFAELK